MQELEEKGIKYEGIPSAREAFEISEKYDVPLHPLYTFFGMILERKIYFIYRILLKMENMTENYI